MATSARPARGAGRGERRPTVDMWWSTRRHYVDNLKVILIAAIIAGHAIISYTEFDWWSYADVREVTLATATVAILFAVAAPFGLFVIPLLFLVGGLLTPPSMQRKGIQRYVYDRLVRLGVPFVIFALLLWPLLAYGLFRWLGQAPGLWDYLAAEGSLDTGVLWFVGVRRNRRDCWRGH
jgi:fucose 4-O-acetylase-like acetyltransferase